MKILVTFPGRAGDILWALPTIRAISEAVNAPISLQICGEFHTLVPLLRLQPYLDRVEALPNWVLVPPAEWQPPTLLEGDWDEVVHLGYRGWPQASLPFETFSNQSHAAALDLTRPWITVAPHAPCRDPRCPCSPCIPVGFTETHFELKLGVLVAMDRYDLCVLTPPQPPGLRGTRWIEETHGTVRVHGCDWLDAASLIAQAPLFVGDCSALHVLAVGLGVPVVVMEPHPDRWNPIFYPVGTAGPQVTLVRGNDGQPTHDARHTGDVLLQALIGKEL